MHTHSVYFWLRDGVNSAGRVTFRRGLEQLAREPHVRDRRIGGPAATLREVVNSTYGYALVLRFDDIDGHDAYQVSDEHQAFLDTCLGMIDRVQVYDIAETGSGGSPT